MAHIIYGILFFVSAQQTSTVVKEERKKLSFQIHKAECVAQSARKLSGQCHQRPYCHCQGA
eukprot:scaffold185197_cov33-Prasinocladus_malaysianus.AAC.1